MACQSLPRLTKTRIYGYETLFPNRCEPSIEALNFGWGWEEGDQGRCERRSEVFVKIEKKNLGVGGGGSGRGEGSGWGGGQVGCE